MKNIILSYDYELFFGYDSGTVQKSIIQPTEYILQALDKCNLKANFFVDYLMIKALRQQSDPLAREDLLSIESQIRDIVKRGHRIELHIHPHWIDAKYIGNGKWDFSDFDHYCIQSLTSTTIASMFDEGCKMLTNILRPIDPSYKIVAFRAGGWAVQPFDKIKRAMSDCNIIIDSSAARNVYSVSGYSKCDFRFIPNDDYYHFSNDISEEDKNGEFIEVPITTYRRKTIHRILDHGYGILFPKKLKKYADGTHQLVKGSISKKHSEYAMYSLSQRSFLTIILNLITTKRKFLVFIDHPKDFTFSVLENLHVLSLTSKTLFYKDILNK